MVTPIIIASVYGQIVNDFVKIGYFQACVGRYLLCAWHSSRLNFRDRISHLVINDIGPDASRSNG